jgi:hypothetical protein
MRHARNLVEEATTELTAARVNLSEVIDTLQVAQTQTQKATLALAAAQTRIRQGEARLRSAHEALKAAEEAA